MIARADHDESGRRMTKDRGCNNQPSTVKWQRQAVVGNKSKRIVAGNVRQKGVVASNESVDVDACTTAGDDESRQWTTEQNGGQ
jgi:hypothetical protein